MSRIKFERDLETALQEIETAAESIGSDPTGRGGFCVTYKFPQIDWGNAAEVRNIVPPLGFRGEVLSAVITNVTEVHDSAETFNLGIDGGDTDAYLALSTVAAVAVGASVRAGLVAGASGYTAIPNTGAELVLTTTSAGATGISDLHLTIRYYL